MFATLTGDEMKVIIFQTQAEESSLLKTETIESFKVRFVAECLTN